MSCRIRISLLGALACSLAASLACAQDFPTKPLRIVVPYPGASSPDIAARSFANVLAKRIGQPVLVENKGGGGGVPAILELRNSPHDGHTLLWPDSSQWAVLPALRADLPYDPVRDFAPIGMVYSNALYFFVRAESPLKTMADVIARAKQKPGELRYGVTGVGGIMHVTGEAWRIAAGVSTTVVPYRASAESLASVMNGDLDYCLAGWGAIKELHRTGKLRALASTGPKRDKYSPDIPSVNEFGGVKSFDFQADIGLVAYAGTSKAAVDKLSSQLHAVQRDSAFLDTLKSLEYDVTISTPEQFAAKIRDDLEKMRAVVKAANIKVQ